ncbi:YcjX family protein [Fodinicurvata fenggangensis]|uniref:YcjX family protein n=1 Tax=Fodinicurvata fenggangensis TaxID=1121830 RepID=UPI00138E0B80|nr:YcjX family protein [Fodinicurvata fenggangensis]
MTGLNTNVVHDWIDTVTDAGRGLLERRLRLGITGLSSSGKTVLLTALVQALLHPERLQGLTAVQEGRYHAAVLRPQPNQHLPRFPFEDNLAQLTQATNWPPGTRRQSELRLSIRYRPTGLQGRLSDGVLHLDLFDYPGEWLMDLALLGHDHASWSSAVLEEMQQPRHEAAAREFRQILADLDPDRPDPEAEQKAMQAAEAFRSYLRQRQEQESRALLLHPGRFLLPGELEGAPVLTFAPLPPANHDTAWRRRARNQDHSLRELMEQRFASYRDGIVRPFHRRHFMRLDRQLVLVDLLAHLSRGSEGLKALDHEMQSLQEALRIGRSWLPRRLRAGVDRVLFACSKADHLPGDQHEILEGLLARSLAGSLRQTRFRGAETETMTLAALRATREVTQPERPNRRYVAGIPLGGQQEVAHYPGQLSLEGIPSDAFEILAFQPPVGLSSAQAWPHIRLDRALQYLIGDRLA